VPWNWSGHHWFQAVISNLLDHQADTTLLVAWRAWFTRNEATHDKVLPPVESSKCFLSSYLNMIRNIKDVPTEATLRGKQPLLISAFLPSPILVKKGTYKAWVTPPTGWVKSHIGRIISSFRSHGGSGICTT
jgi:hypothetical protein